MANNENILFFVRYPQAGAVKTRLAAEVGADTAQQLYSAFVLDVLKQLRETRTNVSVFYEPADMGAAIRQWLGEGLAYFPQEGDDIGERMQRAFGQSFDAGFTKAVLVGSDIPELTRLYVEDAFAALEFDDAVIGPATDGGYYLIGFEDAGFTPEVFDSMPWGLPDVFERTMAVLKEFQSKVHQLPPLADIDVKADLEGLAQRLSDGSSRAPRTRECMEKLGLIAASQPKTERRHA
jgi:uncharacterized protein